MRIDDASHLARLNESSNATLVLSAIAAGELSVIQIEPEDTSLEVLLAALSLNGRPVIITLSQQHWVFSNEQDFARAKDAADIVSFVIPRERMADIGKFASAAGFHFTSQLEKAEAAFLQRQHQYSGPVERTSNKEETMQPYDNSSTTEVTRQQQNGQEPYYLPTPGSLQDTGGYTPLQQNTWNAGYNPVTPLPESFLPGASTPSVVKRPTRKQQFITMIAVVSILIMVSAALLPSLLSQPATLTVPNHQNTLSAPAGSVGNFAFLSSGQLDPNSATGLNDIVLLNLMGLIPPRHGMSDYAWLEADKTQDGIAPILLGKLLVVGGKAQLSYQDKQHTDLLVSYSRLLVTEQENSASPNTPPLDPKTWRYQASIPDSPTPGDEKGYSLLSHMRHLLAKDPTLNQIGLQGGLDIWLYRNIAKIFEWSNAARDDWAGNNVDLTRRQVDRVVQYLDGQVYAFRDLPAGTPWLVDPKAGRPGIIDFTTAQDELGPPSYLSHVKLHLMGMINAPNHTAAQEQQALHIDTALTKIEGLMKKIRSDAIQLAKMSDDQFKQQNALALLDDMQTNANNAYVGQTDPTTGAVQAGEVWVHDQLQSIATIPVTTATPDGP